MMQNVVSSNTYEIMIFIVRACPFAQRRAGRTRRRKDTNEGAFGVENLARDLVRGRTTSQTRMGAKRMRKGACEGFRSELQFAPVEDHLRSLLLLASCDLSDASGSLVNRQSR